MKGLQIWAVSNCRSVMAFYGCLAREFNVPLRILCDDLGEARFKLGWDRSEYSQLDIVQASPDIDARAHQLDEHMDWVQWFGAYQSHSLNRKLMVHAKEVGSLIGVGSEAPSNSVRPSIRHCFKNSSLYFEILRQRCRKAIDAASFVVNYSGDSTIDLQRIGWPVEKVIPFGYYPEVMPGVKFRGRTEADWKNFTMLVTGVMDWRRGQDVVVQAMRILKRWEYLPHVIMTQTGELYDKIAKDVSEFKLNIELVGFAEYKELLRYYSECSIFLAPGRVEPWGMRINDALNAGAPLIVSRGMGGCKIVHEYSCGSTFNSGDALDLAWQIKRLIDSRECYLKMAGNVHAAARACTPEVRAKWLAREIRDRFAEWR